MTLPTPSQIEVSNRLYWFDILQPPGDDIYTFTDPCAPTYGENVLRDGAFSAASTLAHQWYDGTDRQMDSGPPSTSPSEKLTDLSGVNYYYFGAPSPGQTFFAASTQNPRTGSHHLRYTAPTTSATPGITATLIRFAGFDASDCSGDPYAGDSLGYNHQLVTAALSSGDVVSFTAYVTDGSNESSTEVWSMVLNYWSGSTGAVDGSPENTYHGSKGSYTQIDHTSTAPAGAKWVTAHLQVVASTAHDQANFDLDDVSVVITT